MPSRPDPAAIAQKELQAKSSPQKPQSEAGLLLKELAASTKQLADVEIRRAWRDVRQTDWSPGRVLGVGLILVTWSVLLSFLLAFGWLRFEERRIEKAVDKAMQKIERPHFGR